MFENVIKIARTIIWNGPMGKFEDPNFLLGTKKVAEAVAQSGAFSVVGGGDTLEALNDVGLLDKMSFVSMGGGAMLEFIAGNRLPGLEALGYYG
jgi:3-phosphoglycerate kinase